ncbi:hypothetical protein ACFE04_026330 [Oxalis oulophora]
MATEAIVPCPPVLDRSDVASDTSSSSSANNFFDGPPDQFREAELLAAARSEEYRHLFRLPRDEVLVQDFNCAFQENILFQGHMYLFLHFICFYSNIFGFETKRIIPVHQITSVKRAKTAGIFPTAIEIIAEDKKYLFASFLSRDEAFKLINDGWLQHGNCAKGVCESQESLSESCQENGLVAIDGVNSSADPVNESQFTDSDQPVSVSNGSALPLNMENDTSPSTEVQDRVEVVHEPPANNTISASSSSANTSSWRVEDIDAPNVPEEYTKISEAKFPIKVEEFFKIFFSDASKFTESYHTKSGDTEFRRSRWRSHDEHGHVRNISFQHPLKILFGPKSGSCKEVQKFRVYRNSHLVVSSSQEITDVPYGDCFRVEGLWNVYKESDGSKDYCILQIYVNVNFIKRTVWKGRIVQSTMDECRQTFAAWIDMAHETLRQKNLEKQEEGVPSASMVTTNGRVLSRRKSKSKEHSSETRGYTAGDNRVSQQMPDSVDVRQLIGDVFQRNLLNNITSLASFVGASMTTICSFIKRQSRTTLVLVAAFAVILLMQVTILMLLNRPQHVNMVPPFDYTANGMKDKASRIAWLEQRFHHLNDEVLFVENRLERMRQEHTLLKSQIQDLEHLYKRK